MDSEQLNIENLLAYFNSEKGLASLIDGYRRRDQQLRLAEAVMQALENKEFLLAEVGTGVGKTFAYLIPALLWSAYTGERVVVATRTKALQQQVVKKDIPALHRMLELDFRWAEAKGRENYLCWNKYISIITGRKSLDSEESEFVTAILTWAENTGTGDRSELNISSRLVKHWDLLASQRHTCLRDTCSYREKCFRTKMLKRLEQAQIIVANHALLLSDLMIDNQILPEYKVLVIDEAHNFDREAFDKCSCAFAWYEVLETLGQLCSSPSRKEAGLLQRLKGNYPEMTGELDETIIYSDRLRDFTLRFFALLNRLNKAGPNQNHALVLDSQLLEGREFEHLHEAYREWQDLAQLLLSLMRELRGLVAGQNEEIEMNGLVSRLQIQAEAAFYIMEENLGRIDFLHWVEFEDRQAISLAASPVGMSELLYQRLFSKLESVILVSATMTVNRSFSYPIERLGLEPIGDEERLLTVLEDSPFPYEKQACLLVLSDMPPPESRDFAALAARAVLDAAEAAQGATMVLFTSRQQLSDVSLMIRPLLERQGFNLLVQNEDGDFSTLLTRFTTSGKSVLMGLDMFWEGIDLPGELLRCLVIVRLPFRPPNEPYSSACIRDCLLKSRNAFQHFSLPDATVRFKQGVGRLIRSEEDRGIVVVLDPRLITKGYGRVFLTSIPIPKHLAVSREELPGRIREWFASGVVQKP